MYQCYNIPVDTFEESHVVIRGESLSKVALHYRSRGWMDLKNWRPIYHLTRERTALWHDKNKRIPLETPDLIRPGDLLVVPRSRVGYLTAINKISLLKQDVLRSPNDVAAIRKEEEHFSESLNLLSDALIFVTTIGASAAKAAKFAKLAKTATGTAVKEALKSKTLSAVEMSLKITEYGAKSTGHDNVGKYAEKASKIVHVADLVHGIKEFHIGAKQLSLGKKYWRLAEESVGQVVDAIDVAVEWTQPSKLSKGLIRLFTGVDFDLTIDQLMEDQKQSKEQLVNLLSMRISKLQHEMYVVYQDE